MPPPQLPDDIVAHPRFGSTPMVSKLQVDLQRILRGHWQYDEGRIFPQSVLAADVSRQNFALYPRLFYVDMLTICRKCQRPFLFFAVEQQHWYEKLGFYVDADCVHCPTCRRLLHQEKVRLKRYAQLTRLQHPTRKELMQWVDDTIALLDSGYLTNTQRLQALRARAQKYIPEYAGTERLTVLIRQASPPKTAIPPEQ